MINLLICLLLVLSIVGSPLFASNCYAGDLVTQGKMSENLCNEIEKTEKGEKIPVCVWLEEEEGFDIETEVEHIIGICFIEM